MKHTLAPMKDPARAALVNLFTPPEILHALGVRPQFAEGYSSYLTGGGSERGFLEYAERRGVPGTYCSYHKALIGALEAGVIPAPRFIVTTSLACDANTATFRRAAAHCGAPEFYIDVPSATDDAAVRYVARQLEELAAFAADVLGVRMRRDRLDAAIRNTNESVDYFHAFLERLEENYFPSSAALEMFRIFASHILMGTDDALAFYKMQYQDIRQCGPARGVKRILWSHVLPYYLEPLRGALDFHPERQLLISDMNYDAMTPLDADAPYESMARRLVYNHFNGGFRRKADAVLAMAERLRADGAVCFCHWGCKQSNGGAFLLKRLLRERGIPALVLDGDACDRRNMNGGQAATRLQAFFEMLEGSGG
jgi:benzoyl-CoA reductase/2-hydroxyglutaryl-CoA dehydratase subunit BcrC/BadD/HgdB